VFAASQEAAARVLAAPDTEGYLKQSVANAYSRTIGKLVAVLDSLQSLQAAVESRLAAVAASPSCDALAPKSGAYDELRLSEKLLQRMEDQPADSRPMQAVTRLTAAISHASRTNLQLAGCSWSECQRACHHYTRDTAVAGLRGVRCGGCGLVRYCCPQHQQKDWPHHRRVCRRLARAGATKQT
jgi:hypothetical protein